MMVIDNKFEFGQVVYLKTDTDQLPRIVSEYRVCPTGIIYVLSCGERTSNHYDFELTSEENVSLKVK